VEIHILGDLSINSLAILLLLLQVPAVAILFSRLVNGVNRPPRIQPQPATLDLLGTVSVVVPTLNEAKRLGPCLEGLTRQSYEVREVIVVDSRSTDGTPEMVKDASQLDPRFRLITDDPLPAGWVGRPWALNTGFLSSSQKSEWFLGIDADTQPRAGLVAGLVQFAKAGNYDLISLSPQFILKYPGEILLQPALLMTLIYRFGPPDSNPSTPERVLANGQCFLCRRSVLEAVAGYSSAGGSFCDDVTLARNIAKAGYKVAFLDGGDVIKVRMYEGAWETWREWGRSLDLKDASSPAQVWGDFCLLLALQGLPLFVVLGFLFFGLPSSFSASFLLFGLNLFLVLMRVGMNFAVAGSYDFSTTKAGWLFWLSPLADPLAVFRIFLSSIRKPTQWRGRKYGS
jgi:dolichol-phosphate mannosyltransferase